MEGREISALPMGPIESTRSGPGRKREIPRNLLSTFDFAAGERIKRLAKGKDRPQRDREVAKERLSPTPNGGDERSVEELTGGGGGKEASSVVDESRSDQVKKLKKTGRVDKEIATPGGPSTYSSSSQSESSQ